MKLFSILRLFLMVAVSACLYQTVEAAAGGEILDNPALISLLENKIQLPVIEPKIEISDCRFDVSSAQLILISNAAQKGGMEQDDINKLLKILMKKSGEDQKRISNLVARFINITINYDPSNPQEYESNMRMLLRVGAPAIPFLLRREYIEAESEQKRAGVLDALAKLGVRSEIVIKNAKLMLSDRNKGVRRKAAEAVAVLSGPKTCEELIAELVRPRRIHLDGIAMALGYLGNQKAIESLTILLKRSTNKDARLAAAFALGLLRPTNKDSIQTVFKAILDDGDSRLRIAAAKAAGQIGDARAIAYIIRSFQRYRKGREELIYNLKYFPTADAIEFLITDCASADNPRIRKSAILTLKELANEDYDSAEEWDSWWSNNKDTPRWIRVKSVALPGKSIRK